MGQWSDLSSKAKNFIVLQDMFIWIQSRFCCAEDPTRISWIRVAEHCLAELPLYEVPK